MTYRDTLVQLADTTERDVLTIYRSFIDGLLDRDETVRLIAFTISRANGGAIALADMALAAEAMTQLGTPVPVVGVDVPDDYERLAKAASTVLDVAYASTVSEAIVSRLARSEPLEAAATAYGDAMTRSRYTKGWTRRKSASACQLCVWWWRDGRVWPVEHKFQHHKGCTCTPKPVVAKDIKLTHQVARQEGIR